MLGSVVSDAIPPPALTGGAVKQSTPEETLVSMIRAERDLPWSFLINKNLMVVVKMFKREWLSMLVGWWLVHSAKRAAFL